ncbi:hypothetical protein [Paenibacillus chitinolyticus]|uniref:hypothetical protein n=1 Tax=Paenibacillus chitinolyticus TaxID=79263 RepID=UPI003D0239DE
MDYITLLEYMVAALLIVCLVLGFIFTLIDGINKAKKQPVNPVNNPYKEFLPAEYLAEISSRK